MKNKNASHRMDVKSFVAGAVLTLLVSIISPAAQARYLAESGTMMPPPPMGGSFEGQSGAMMPPPPMGGSFSGQSGTMMPPPPMGGSFEGQSGTMMPPPPMGGSFSGQSGTMMPPPPMGGSNTGSKSMFGTGFDSKSGSTMMPSTGTKSMFGAPNEMGGSNTGSKSMFGTGFDSKSGSTMMPSTGTKSMFGAPNEMGSSNTGSRSMFGTQSEMGGSNMGGFSSNFFQKMTAPKSFRPSVVVPEISEEEGADLLTEFFAPTKKNVEKIAKSTSKDAVINNSVVVAQSLEQVCEDEGLDCDTALQNFAKLLSVKKPNLKTIKSELKKLVENVRLQYVENTSDDSSSL